MRVRLRRWVSWGPARLAVKTGLAVGLSIWISAELGLTDSYWAGISAAVVMSATLGGSLSAALARVLATVVGLLVGLAAVEAFGQGYVVAGVVAGLLVLVLPLVRLEAGARLGAATSLLVTIVP